MRLFNNLNAWELGGYVNREGKKVKSNKLIRTCYLARMSKEQIQALSDVYHVGMIADFRMSNEIAMDPDPEVAGAKHYDIRIVNENIDKMTIDFPTLMAKYNNDRFLVMMEAAASGIFSDQMYVQFISDDAGKKGYAAFLRHVLETPEDQAVLWHCTDGKDRTGIAAMLLLTILDVDEETIVSDYLLTNTHNAPVLKQARIRAQQMTDDQEIIETLVFTMGGVRESYMRNAISYLKETYGSIMGYITEELGLTEAEIRLLKARYLV